MSMKVRESRSWVVTGLVLLGVGIGPSFGDVVVYDNSTTPTGDAMAGATQIGNEITLAGEARYVTSIAVGIRLTGNESGTAEIRIRLFANDGYDAGFGPRPSTVLWTSDWTEHPLEPGVSTFVEVRVPTVEVPDRFTWYFIQRGPEVELVQFHPPTVGSARFGVWLPTGGVALWEFVKGTPPFGARITAGTIPTVSSWGLAMLCLVLLTAGTVLIRRRSRVAVCACAVSASIGGPAVLRAQVDIGPAMRIDENGGTAAANETSIVASADDPNVIVAAWNDWRDSGSEELVRIGVAVSHDGGANWTDGSASNCL